MLVCRAGELGWCSIIVIVLTHQRLVALFEKAASIAATRVVVTASSIRLLQFDAHFVDQRE